MIVLYIHAANFNCYLGNMLWLLLFRVLILATAFSGVLTPTMHHGAWGS